MAEKKRKNMEKGPKKQERKKKGET